MDWWKLDWFLAFYILIWVLEAGPQPGGKPSDCLRNFEKTFWLVIRENNKLQSFSRLENISWLRAWFDALPWG